MKIRRLAVLILFAASALAQTPQAPSTTTPAQNTPPSKSPGKEFPPEKKAPAPAPNKSSPPAAAASPSATATAATTAGKSGKAANRADAYYHYSMAHIYEEMVAIYGRSEYANKAIEEYRKAIDSDPTSDFLNSGLAELYAKTGRIRDAVLEAQDILKRDSNNLEARKLLGRIYLRSLGDLQSGTQSQEVLKLAIEQFEQIVKLEPKSADNHLLLGRLYIINKDLLKAENEFKTAIQLQPDSEEAVTNLAYLYNEEGDAKRAIGALSSVPEGGRSAKLFAALGFTYEQQHDYKKAIEAYRKAVRLDKENPEALRGLAQNLMNDGQTEAALEQYKLIADIDPQDAQAYLRMSEIQRRNGKFDPALESLKKAEALVQDSLEVPYNLALIYEAQGKFEEGITTLQKLLERTAKNDADYTSGERNNRAVFLERLGMLQREAGKTPQAIETFRKILDLGPENAPRAYQQLIDTYRENKQWAQATAVAQEGVGKLPQDRGLRLVLASQLADSGRADEGISQARSLLKGNATDDREVYIALGQMYSRLKRWKESEEALAKAEELSVRQEEKDVVAFIQGSTYERQKKYEQAEERFRQVLKGDPQNAMALNYLGYMLADRGVRLDEAAADVKKALDLDPQNGAYLDSLGWVYYKQGKYNMAEEYLRKAVEKMPNDATIHDHIGDVYQKLDKLKLAASHWERALSEWAKSVSAEVDNVDVAKVQKKLETARVKLAKQSR